MLSFGFAILLVYHVVSSSGEQYIGEAILARESESQWDVWIVGVESSSETAGSLRNPKTRRTPSYRHSTIICVQCDAIR